MPGQSGDPLAYYATPGPMTDPGEHANWLEELPADLPALCRVVQGSLLHIFWAERYGVTLSEARRQEVQYRSVREMLAHMRAVDDRPFTIPRPLEKRQVGNCRDFATMLCALLRHQGVPARARCGFATYFERGKYVDHWICEYWRADAARWVRVDAQLDELERSSLGLWFDPYDMLPETFLTGGKAWQSCRAGVTDPERFGIMDMWGLWFIRGNLLRDLAALNKVELLPWDCWGLIDKGEDAIDAADMALLDQVAGLTQESNAAFAQVRDVYEGDARLRVPPVIRSYTDTGIQRIALGEAQ